MVFEVATTIVPWLKAFVFTQMVEVPIYRWGLPARWGPAIMASTITHPFVWFAFPWLGDAVGLGWTATAAVSEVFAWGVEAIYLRWASARVSWRRAAAASLIANAASLGLGLAVRATLGIV